MEYPIGYCSHGVECFHCEKLRTKQNSTIFSNIKPRRLYEDDKPDGYMESDNDFMGNNREACVWFLEKGATYIESLENERDSLMADMVILKEKLKYFKEVASEVYCGCDPLYKCSTGCFMPKLEKLLLKK